MYQGCLTSAADARDLGPTACDDGTVEPTPGTDEQYGIEQGQIERNRIERNRELWDQVNEDFAGQDGVDRWDALDLGWGLFRRPEAQLSLLGDVERRDVVELGCGTAHVAAWAARRGARCTAVDLSGAQLMTARRCQMRSGPQFPLIQADGEHVPLRDGCADLVVSEHGVGAWCDPQRWVPEAARLLRPGGRLVFMTNSPLSALCVPDESGPAGDRLLRAVQEVRTVSWPGGGIEHHPSHGEWIQILRAAGFVIDELLELSPPVGSADPDWYEIVTAEWAGRWPAEDVWVAHLE